MVLGPALIDRRPLGVQWSEMIDAADRTMHSRMRTMPVAVAAAWALGCLLGSKSGMEGGLAFCECTVAVMRGVQDILATRRWWFVWLGSD